MESVHVAGIPSSMKASWLQCSSVGGLDPLKSEIMEIIKELRDIRCAKDNQRLRIR